MTSLGPVPLPPLILVLAFALALLVAHIMLHRQGKEASPRGRQLLFDMLIVGVVAARLGFALWWWERFLPNPLDLIRIGDGGFSVWTGLPAALAFGAWRLRGAPALRLGVMQATAAGLVAWVVMSLAYTQLQPVHLDLPGTAFAVLDGGEQRLDSGSGEPMVINLWATWCPPCRREMPALVAAQREHPDVRFILLNQGESADEVRAYLASAGLAPANVLLDPSSSASEAFDARALPTTVFLDAEGRLVERHLGELTAAGLAARLQDLR